MREEVNHLVLHWIDDQLAKQVKPTLTAILHKLGFQNVEDSLFEWAWIRPKLEPAHILTVWSEDIAIDEHGGWMTGFSLDPSLNPFYTPVQIDRERRRIKVLNALVQSGRDCKVILMINRRSREEESRGIAAEAESRVLDSENWYTDIEDGARVGTLRRGPRIVKKDASPSDLGTAEPQREADIGTHGQFRFPDQEMRDRVEHAAIEYAKAQYTLQGHVESVEALNLGYDLKVTDKATGEIILKVEVKGTAGEEECFFLTRNENREAVEDSDLWRLAVVTGALHSPNLQEYRLHEMENMFRKDPLVWYCFPKRR